MEELQALALSKEIVENGCQLIKCLLSEPFTVCGSAIADRIAFWQWNNRIKIAARAKMIIDSRGWTARLLPDGFFLHFLRECGDVDDERLQEMWANLLASSISDDLHQHPSFIATLRQMSANDARVLTIVRTVFNAIHSGHRLPRPLVNTREVCRELDLSHRHILLSVTNLSRLGLLTDDAMWPDHNPSPDGDKGFGISLTAFGAHFTTACLGTSV